MQPFSNTSEHPIGSVELLYLKDGKKFLRQVDEHQIESVHKLITETYDAIVSSFNEDVWPAIPSKLCNWCFFKDTICEYWKKEAR